MAIKFLNTVAVDTDVLYVDAASNEVGINTTSPERTLHVKSSQAIIAKLESEDTFNAKLIIQHGGSSNNQAYLNINTPSNGKRRITLGRSNNVNERDNLKIENQIATNYTKANMAFGGTGVGATTKFGVTYDYNTNQDTGFTGINVDANITGTTAITGDKTLVGVGVDMDSDATGGNTTQELTLKGVNVDVANKTSGDANHIYGVFSSAKNVRTGTGDNMTSITGGYFQAYSSAQSGQVSNMYGVEAITYIEDATHTVNNAYAVYGRTTINDNFDDTISTRAVGGYFVTQVESGNNNQVPQAVGIYAENEIASDITNIKGVEIVSDINGGTTTNSYLIRGSSQIANSATVTNNWGLYLDSIDKNYIDGTLGINNSNPSAQLVVRNSGVSNSVLKLEDSGGNQLLSVFEDSSGNAETSMRDGTGAMTIKFDTDGWSFINGGRLGVGTSTPSQTLEVAGNIQATSSTGPLISAVYDADHYMRIEGNSSGGILKGADGGVITTLIRTYGSSYFNGGNVGIGTTTPATIFHIAAQTTPAIRIEDTTNNRHLQLFTDNNSTYMRSSTGTPIYFQTDGANTRMFISSGGQIQFSDYGSGAFTGTATKNLAVDSSGNIIETDGSIMDGSGTANYVSKWSDANTLTDSQIFDNGTNVGIGTASPLYPLHIKSENPIVTINDTTSTARYAALRFQTAGGGWNVSSGDSTTGTSSNLFITRATDGTSNRFVFDRDLYRFGVYDNTNTIKAVIRANGNSYFNGGNVGIGTTSPSYKLDVAGDIIARDTYPTIYLDHSGTVLGGLRTDATNKLELKTLTTAPISFQVNSSEKMRITDGGNVGIGTTSPAEKLVVSEARSGTNAAAQTKYTLVSRSTISSGTPGTGGIKVVYDDGSNEHAFGLVSGSTSADFLTSGPMHWYTNSDLNTHSATGFAMTIDTSQRLGIGTTSPAYKLDVNGDGRINGVTFVASGATRRISTHSNSGQLQLNGGTNSSGGAYININGSGYSSGRMTLYSPESIYLNSNVGIGTASPDRSLVINHASDTRVKLQVNGTDTAQIQTVANEARYHALGSSTPLQFWTNGAERARIDTSGNVGIGTTSPTTDLHVDGSALVTSNATVRGDLRIDKNPSSFPSAKLQFLRNGVTSPAMGEIIMSDNPGHAGMYMYARRTTSPYTTSYIELPTSTNYDFEINLLGTNAVTIDSSTRNFGIGTTSPGYKLDVQGQIRLKSVNHQVIFHDTDSGVDEWAITTYGNTGLSFFDGATTGSAVMTLLSGGNVGIGTTSPSSTLEVSGEINCAGGDGYRIDGKPFANFGSDLLTLGDFDGEGYKTRIMDDNSAEVMRITGGKVGIGETNPQQKLHVGGRGLFETGGSTPDATTSTYEKGITLTGGNMRLVIDTSNVSNGGSYIQTRHNSTSFPNAYYTLALNPLGGKVGIGTTAPAEKLTVSGSDDVVIRINSTKNGTWTAGDSLGALEFFGNDASGGQGAGLKGKIDVTSFNQYGAAFDMKFFTSNGSTDPTTENFKIAYDGGIFAPNLLGSSNSNPDVRYNTTTNELYYNSSSIRYKEDVTDLENSLDKINNLRPVKFKDKESGEYATGLIAEEVVNVLPELVFKRQIEGFNEPQIDGVSYGDLHAYYIKAIQQLKSEIETLKSQIN